MARIRTIKPELWIDRRPNASAAKFSIYCITESGNEFTGPCKVGIATNLEKRLCSLQGGNWRPLVLVWQVKIAQRDHAKEVEQYCLQCLRPSIYTASTARLCSEWLGRPPLEVLKVSLRYLNAEEACVTRAA